MEYRVVATDIEFAEGPLELPGGDILYTEIRAGTLTRVSPDGSRKETFATTGGGPNGAALGPDGAIYVTQKRWLPVVREPHLQRRARDLARSLAPRSGYIGGQIQRVSADGSEVTTIYRECDGEPLKGPNDLVFDREGNFYFTDHGKRYGRQRDITGVFLRLPEGRLHPRDHLPPRGPERHRPQPRRAHPLRGRDPDRAPLGLRYHRSRRDRRPPRRRHRPRRPAPQLRHVRLDVRRRRRQRHRRDASSTAASPPSPRTAPPSGTSPSPTASPPTPASPAPTCARST